MDYHSWSSLYRGYDLKLRHNQLMLVLSAVGAVAGFFFNKGTFWPNVYAAIIAGATMFAAGALAKELDPDGPLPALVATIVMLLLIWVAHPVGVVALFWLIGCVRFINRSSGQRPKPTDTLVLLVLAIWLSWQEIPIFGILFGALLILEGLLPDGQRIYAALGLVVLIICSTWLFLGDWAANIPPFFLAVALLLIAVAFIAVILSSYHISTVGDTTGDPLNPSRVQAGQAIALSAGLFLASWRGETGVELLIALWAALLGILADRALLTRLRQTYTSL